MTDEHKGSPYRRHRNDPEAPDSTYEDDEDDGSPFNIARTKSAPLDQLRRWRVSSSHCLFLYCELIQLKCSRLLM